MTTETTTDITKHPARASLGELIADYAPAPVLDLNPAIQRKRQTQCVHEYVEVDDTSASLTCKDCGAELDPWWYLRALARRGEEASQYRAARIEAFEAWEKSVSMRLTHYESEIRRLAAKRDQLWNEKINGVPLGSIGGRRRRARKVSSL